MNAGLVDVNQYHQGDRVYGACRQEAEIVTRVQVSTETADTGGRTAVSQVLAPRSTAV